MLNSTVGRLRLVGMIEAISFLLLLGVAMPLKYIAGLPVAVQIAGWIHGILFISFCALLLNAHQKKNWPATWSATVLVAALLPFGPFVIDRRLREKGENEG